MVETLSTGKPRIAISLAYYDVESAFERKYHVMETYVEAIKRAGGFPVLFPILYDEDIDFLLDQVEGVLMTGGGGLLPHIKKMDRLPSLAEQNPRRHRHDCVVVEKAVERGLPLMGVCRGHQVINEVFGGSLIENLQDITTWPHKQEEPADQGTHLIRVESDSILSTCFTDQTKVNSFHNQSVDRPGRGLRVTALSEDGVVEAVEGTGDQFILGLQFHPEDMLDIDNMYLNPYRRLVESASAYRQRK